MILSDMPGSFLTAGKWNVIGLRGETDWQILTATYANGEFKPGELLDYMQLREITTIHLSDVEDPLVKQLMTLPDAPRFERMDSFSPPHRVFRVDWL